MSDALGRAAVDGRTMPLEEACLALTDEGVTRGDGAFETLGIWGGRPFRVADHLERLAESSRALGLDPPDRSAIERDVEALVSDLGPVDAALRVYATASGTRAVTLTGQPVRDPARRLVTQPAPWVRPLGSYGPAGAKTMSYAPNMAAWRAAERAGGDDALLVSTEGLILEGPTFCVLWAREGTVYTPAADLGIVDSISRRTLIELVRAAGGEVLEGRWPVHALADADEVMICSSVRPVISIREVDDYTFGGSTPVAEQLAAWLDERRRRG